MARIVNYAGGVQGVGFRATVAAIARGYAVVGWVRNLPDGRVQLLAEGTADAVEAFLAAVRVRWARHIDTEQSEDRPPTGQYRDFTVAR